MVWTLSPRESWLRDTWVVGVVPHAGTAERPRGQTAGLRDGDQGLPTPLKED